MVIQWTGGKHSGHTVDRGYAWWAYSGQGVNIVVIQWTGGKHSGHTVDRG